MEFSRDWLRDQPFSSEPALQSSYVAAVVLEDYDAAKDIATKGLVANPNRFGLLNNLAFAQVNREDVEAARKTINKVRRQDLTENERVVLRATEGLLAFRSGHAERGRKRYMDAISTAKARNQTRLLALASAYHALEEYRQQSEEAVTAGRQALRLLQADSDLAMGVLRDRLADVMRRDRTLGNR